MERTLAPRAARRLAPWVLLALSIGAAASPPGEDLAKKYRGKLDREPIEPHEWSAGPGDVWALKSFRFERKGELALELGPSQVVLGVSEKCVLWAALFPDEPAEIQGRQAGAGDHAASVFLRFHPARVGELLPAKNVTGPGRPEMLAWGKRLYRHKIRAWNQSDDFPLVPERAWTLLDCETREGPRRLYIALDDSGQVTYAKEFEAKPLPSLVPIAPEDALAAFDQAWSSFDATYAKFGLRPDVDWDAQRAAYRPWAERSKTTFEAAAAIAECLAKLRDLHVWVTAGDEPVYVFDRVRAHNASWKAADALVGSLRDTQRGARYGRTKDGLGYLSVNELSDAGLVKAFDEALESLGDTWGLVLDLRFNGGGDELMAREIAGRFLDRPRVYAANAYRAESGGRTALAQRLERSFDPRGPWRYAAPVVALWGRRTMSSAESLAMMLAQCPDVTSLGDRTAGSSANPTRLDLPGGIQVNLPRWNDMDPEGKPIEDVGFAPDVAVKADAAEFTDERDPVLEAALERLRKLPKAKRKPGKAQ